MFVCLSDVCLMFACVMYVCLSDVCLMFVCVMYVCFEGGNDHNVYEGVLCTCGGSWLALCCYTIILCTANTIVTQVW